MSFLPIVRTLYPGKVLPQPTFDEIRRFCEIDGWSKKESARGKTGDHDRYVKRLGDGSVLRTKASHSKDQIKDPSLWHRIWKEQLGLESQDQFWTALRTRTPVPRGTEAPKGTPDWLIRQLIHTVGLTEDEALALSPEEAEAHWERFITSPHDA
jgi:hypothetical protein